MINVKNIIYSWNNIGWGAVPQYSMEKPGGTFLTIIATYKSKDSSTALFFFFLKIVLKRYISFVGLGEEQQNCCGLLSCFVFLSFGNFVWGFSPFSLERRKFVSSLGVGSVP